MKADDVREVMNSALAKWYKEFPNSAFMAQSHIESKIGDAASKGASNVEIEEDELKFPGFDYEHAEIRNTLFDIILGNMILKGFDVNRLKRGYKISWGLVHW
jgi:hypothetical protein